MSPLRSFHRARRGAAAVVAAALVAAVPALALTPAPAYAVASVGIVPKTPVVLPLEIEPMPPYQPQTYCDPHDKPGVVAFAALLTSTYPDTSTVDISRPCSTDTSEHYDGRALDWGAYYKNAAQVKEVDATFAWLFAPDAAGNPNAMLRRLGIMYVIWNKQIWGSWSQKWEPYACSGETACHQNHVHFSFDWSGALKKTSFWTGVVRSPMPPPIPVLTSKTVKQTVRVAARAEGGVTTPFAVKTGYTYRLTVTGTYRWGTAGADVADALCATAYKQPTWSALAPGETTTANVALHDLAVGPWRGWHPVTNTGGGCNTATHTYTMTLHPPTTRVLTMSVNDPNHADNSGTLTVTVQRVA